MTVSAGVRRQTGLDEPHHDGSDPYVLQRADELGASTVVRLRVPDASATAEVAVRYLRDGEPRFAQAVVDEERDGETWWRAEIPVHNPSVRYRFLLAAGGDRGYSWVNGLGRVDHDVPDADDFVTTIDPGGPDWHLRSVVYEIFPDRFARSGVERQAPDWVVPRAWDEPVSGRSPQTSVEWYGGDLAGIEQHLDHVETLGADVVYLTPVFPARSIHRYDASSFERVDPLLGGDEALALLVAAAHTRGIRVIGDLTLNHSGDQHDWFRDAVADPAAGARDHYYFDEALSHGYEAWLGVRTLPKLDHRSEGLRRRLVLDQSSAVRRWLRPPYRLDGWRIDVANMAGRYRDLDLTHQLAAAVRGAMSETRPDAVLVAEHAHDARGDLQGGGWHGTMNYSGFLRPMWAWLRGDVLEGELATRFLGVPSGAPRIDAAQAAATMRAFRAGVPWQSIVHSWTLLDSHDTARFGVVSGSRERHLVGIGVQMTTPGVPMIFAGDELGLGGAWGEDARRTMPWDRPETWDVELLRGYRHLAALRRSSDALAHGGIRIVHAAGETLAYLRETRSERLLCLALRGDDASLRLSLGSLGCGALETLAGADASCSGGEATLPSGGPSFHVWRLIDG